MRLRELDVFRGIAAASVFLFHFGLADYGYLGVQLFFILSGFVIFMSARSGPAASFVVRRFSRLFPTYCACVLLTSIVLLLDRRVPDITQLFANLTMLQRYLGFEDIDGSYWTLTVELFFYGIISVCLLTSAVRDGRLLPTGLIALAICGLVLDPTLAPQRQVMMLLRYLGLFAAGIYFFRIYEGEKGLRPWFGVAIAYLVTIAYSYGETLPGWNPVIEKLILLACFGAFGLCATGRLHFLARSRSLVFMGNISFPFYLLHNEIGKAFAGQLPSKGLEGALSIAAIFTGTILLAWWLHEQVELKVSITLRKRLLEWTYWPDSSVLSAEESSGRLRAA